MPVSALDGRAPRAAHIYHYAPDGRVEWVEVLNEPLWEPEDVLWAEALHHIESNTCSGCGHSRDETTSPTYVAVVDTEVCYSCRSIAVMRRADERKHHTDPETPAPGRPRWDDGLSYYTRRWEGHQDIPAIRPE